MTQSSSTTSPTMWVAIDIAQGSQRSAHRVAQGRRRHFRVANTLEDFAKFAALLSSSGYRCRIAFEAHWDYHRPWPISFGPPRVSRSPWFLPSPSPELATPFTTPGTRTIQGRPGHPAFAEDGDYQVYYRPSGASLPRPTGAGQHLPADFARKVRLHHSIVTHYLPLYFPEAEAYLHSTRAEWFTPTPAVALVPRLS